MTIHLINPLEQWEIITMFIVVISDWLSGVAKAIKLKNYRSEIGLRGILQHFIYWLSSSTLIWFALMCDAEYVAIPVMFAFIYPYAISIMANWSIYGVTFPKIITDFIEYEMQNKIHRNEKKHK
nr:MAG TPA: holin [Caudoviricetes sp.]